MKEGTPMYAMMKPWSAPTAAPMPMPEREREQPLEGDVGAETEDAREPVGHPERVAHRDQPDERSDREVDVARHDHQDHPVAMIAMPAAWTDIVIMLSGWMSVRR
jgi:hypothetical protein